MNYANPVYGVATVVTRPGPKGPHRDNPVKKSSNLRIAAFVTSLDSMRRQNVYLFHGLCPFSAHTIIYCPLVGIQVLNNFPHGGEVVSLPGRHIRNVQVHMEVHEVGAL